MMKKIFFVLCLLLSLYLCTGCGKIPRRGRGDPAAGIHRRPGKPGAERNAGTGRHRAGPWLRASFRSGAQAADRL